MSELAKRMLDSLARRGDQNSPRPPGVSAGQVSAGLSLQVQVPGAHAQVAEELTLMLRDLMDRLVQDIGVTGHVGVDVTEHDDASVMATIFDRPVALLSVDGLASDEFVPVVGHRVLDGLLRRLPLLSSGSGAREGAGYLADLGCAADPLVGEGVEAAERAIDDRVEERIEVEVPTSMLRNADAEARDAVLRFRTEEQYEYGTVYPDLRVHPVDGPDGSVRLRLNDVWLPPHELGPRAGWVDVVDVVAGEVRSRRHWFLRTRDVSEILDHDLAFLLPDLVEVTRSNFSPELLTACLRELLRNDKRIRNLPRILWMLLEQGDRPPGPDMVRLAESPLLPKARYGPRADTDPVLLAARVRKLHNEESWRLGNHILPANAYRLPADIEEALTASAHGSAALSEVEWAAVRTVSAATDLKRVVTRTIEAIAPVRAALQAVSRPLRVTASQELPPDADLTRFPILSDPRTEE